MDGPGRAAEPCGGADARTDDGASEPRWPQPPSEGADHPAEPRCETPLSGPQPTPTSLPTLLADRPESSQANVHREAEEDADPTRESCGSRQRPFPVPEDAAVPEEQEDVSPGRDGQGFAVGRPRSRLRSLAFQRLCCEHSRELYELIVERKTPEDASSLPGALSTDESVGSEANLLLSEEKEDWRQQKILVARELADQSLKLTATRGRTPEPVVSAAEPEAEPRLEKEPEPESWPEEESEAELSPEEEPELEPWPEEKPELEPRPEEKPELEPRPEEKPELEPQLEEKPEKEPQPKEPKPEPQPKKKPEAEHRPKKEPRPKSEHRRKKEPRPKSQPEEDPMSRSALGYDFSLLGKKVEKAKLVQKYYKNGKKFLTMLPDGTSQLFYPSGNVAIIMTGDKDHHSLIVQEDELRTTKIRALFQSDGRSTCYYRNGDEWINMSTQGGQYLDQAGNRVRRWMWPNLSPEPHVPLSPIFISLNRHVGVRILAQDKIFVSFLAMGRQAKFNMGTRVQVTVPVQSHSSQREWGSQGRSHLCLSRGGCSLCCPMLLPPKASCGGARVPATPLEMGHLPALCKGPQCGTPVPGKTLATSPRVSRRCHREQSCDPCGQGARQLSQGRFVCREMVAPARPGWLCDTPCAPQVSAGSQLPPAAQLGEDELLLLAFRVRILQLFDRMRGCINFPSGEQWNKMQPPMYLINQAVKILELCMAADISDELRSSIKAIVNAQQL
ncbi:glutamate-rich protein 6 [Sylvia atricapilla]|uniref:glutamate-rich protein 6 n=1 Tax=Sylvia atricapilla TaxID=48155 RepID=UPI00339AC157